MSFTDIKFDNEKIFINIKNDDYFIFNRQIHWLGKYSDCEYFPNIVDIDYINKNIECEIQSSSNKKLKEQLEEIEEILKSNNCQLNHLDKDDIIVKNNTIIIVKMFWCIDLSIGINQDINYWSVDDNTSNIDRIDFLDNRFILDKILDKLGVDILLDDITFILFCENYETYEKNKDNLNVILNYCNYIVVNDNNDVYRLKLEVSSFSNKIDIIFNDSKNIFENIDLFKFICQSKTDKKILVNINVSENKNNSFYNTKKILNSIRKNDRIGLIYQKNMNKHIGIYGDINNCLEIKKICCENNIDFLNYISDDKDYIDWDSYDYGDNLKDKKMHWLTEGLQSNLRLPIKKGYEYNIPQISMDNNFAIDFYLYKNFFKNFNYNVNYSDRSYIYFFYYLICHFDKTYDVIE